MYTRPNSKEIRFLTMAYNGFYDLYEEYKLGNNDPEKRFGVIKNIFSIYSECLKYEPIKHYIQILEKNRPEGDSKSLEFFGIIRHLLTHFPFYKTWNEVSFSRDLILWCGGNSKIDNFFLKNEGKESFKWRIWDNKNKVMKYGFEIHFPNSYSQNGNIYLKDLIDEEQGLELSFYMIKSVLETQIESVV